MRCGVGFFTNLAHSSPRCEGLFPPTTRTILHQPHSKPTLPGSAFFCARFSPSAVDGFCAGMILKPAARVDDCFVCAQRVTPGTHGSADRLLERREIED